MEDKRSLEEIHAAICEDMKRMYSEKGEQITDKEAVEAANNLIRFYDKLVEIKVRQMK